MGGSELGCQFWVPRYCMIKDVKRHETFATFCGSESKKERNLSFFEICSWPPVCYFVVVVVVVISTVDDDDMMMGDKQLGLGVRNLVWKQNINTNINSVPNIILTRRVSANHKV